jgi:tripartite-type tricarboxylate transporter receptor subunit TctC
MRFAAQMFGCVFAATFACGATAQSFPTRTVRIVVGFSPGGSMDVTARFIADRLKDPLGQQVIVDNRPGASGSIAADYLTKAPPDGHTTMLAGGGTLTIRQTLEPSSPYLMGKAYEPVIRVANLPLLLVVSTGLPAKSLKELLALARAHPGQLNFSSSGIGATTHLSGEMLKALARVNITHIPYKGSSQMMPDLIAGQISLAFDQITTAQPYVAAGKLRALAISTAKRSALMPAMPTVAESGVPGYECISWNGLVVPPGTPRALIDRLQQDTDKVLKARDMIDRLASIGAEPVGGTPDEFAAFLKADAARWGQLIQRLGLKAQ